MYYLDSPFADMASLLLGFWPIERRSNSSATASSMLCSRAKQLFMRDGGTRRTANPLSRPTTESVYLLGFLCRSSMSQAGCTRRLSAQKSRSSYWLLALHCRLRFRPIEFSVGIAGGGASRAGWRDDKVSRGFFTCAHCHVRTNSLGSIPTSAVTSTQSPCRAGSGRGTGRASEKVDYQSP